MNMVMVFKKDRNRQFLAYLLIIVITLMIDMTYLSFFMKGFYDVQLSAFERTIRILPALIVWILIPVGIIIFVLPKSKDIKKTVLYGAMFGFIVYGVYDFTNYAILKDYSLVMTIVDLIWGTFLCGFVSFIGKIIMKKLQLN